MRGTKILLLILLVCLSSVTVFGWSRHNLLTRIILEDVEWLKKYENVKVTEYKYDDPTINPDFVVYYEPPEEAKKIFIPDGEFFDYYQDWGSYYGFKGKKLGETTSAYEILCDYSDEPDWDMDKNMKHGFNQAFMGGPQGFRHMYYPFGYFKVANVILPQGKTPDRVDYYYKKAKEAFEKGDTYWGFRFLARCLHYLEDVGNPYHTKQTSGKFIHWNDPVGSTTTVTKNYHAVWEVYFGNALSAEYVGKNSSSEKKLIPYLKSGNVEQVQDPKSLTKKTARRSARLARKCFILSIEFFGKHYDVLEDTFMNDSEFWEKYRGFKVDEPPENKTARTLTEQNEVHETCGKAFKITSTAVKSFMEYARQDLNL